MVLDLRLNEKIGLSGDNLLFCTLAQQKVTLVETFFFFVKKMQKNLRMSKKSSTFALAFEI